MDILQEGRGELIGWHDPDENRRWVQKHKSRDLTDKRMSLAQAVEAFVHDGDLVAMGGFGHIRVSMAAIYQMIRQGRRDLVLAGKTAVHDSDVLIAAGCVSRIEVAYAFGHELRGLSPASRRMVESGQCRVVAEISNAGFQWRFLAAMMGLPFIPSRNLLGTDTLAHSSAKVVSDPWSGKPICLLPACFPDVVFIHVPRCDLHGNAQVDGTIIEDFELARAARRLVLTTEEIIPNDRIRAQPWQTAIPFYLVDAVVHVPWGAHPCQMPYLYYFDEDHIRQWLTRSKTAEGAAEYFAEFVFGVADFEEYLAKIGGRARLERLREIEQLREQRPSEDRASTPQSEAVATMAKEFDYTSTELLACVAARLLEPGKSVFVGTGLPMIAAMLAQRTHAPGLLIIFEAGGIGPRVPVLPISVGDSRTFYQAVAASSMHDVMSVSQAGYIDFGFLGAAQIDRFGNINTTVIGDYDHPAVRLPGSGGANDVGSFCHRTIVVMRQDPRKFVERVDFITTPGYLDGPGARERAGLPADSGPYRVITQLGVYAFRGDTCEMELVALHPGVSADEVRAQSGFPVHVADNLQVTQPPTEQDRRILGEIDPTGLVIQRG